MTLKSTLSLAIFSAGSATFIAGTKEWEEEQGLNVLFLAVGFLHWIDDDGETARSPILLLACDLERASPRDPYYLKREDDDVVVNATLRHVLGKRGLELPDLPDEETPEGYLARLKKHVARRKPEWTVSSEVSLGIFQFSKLAMWEDLEQMRTGVIEHSLIRRLAGAGSNANIEPADSASSPFDRADDVLVGGGMDDLLELRRQFTILPADFSQLRAIEQARAGQHLVIHGPPGTGKSQSIANLIATLLADGKRVLFVSEKTAALDVVKRQLEQAGLGTFCLDLHSERAKKNSVYAQLGDSLTAPTDGQRSEMQLIELEQRRAQLNTVVRALHRPQTKLNLTPYQVHGAYAKVQDAPVVRHTFRGIEDLEPDDLSKIRESAASLAARPDEFRDHYSSHWRPLILLETVASLAELVTGDMEAVLQATAEAGATFTEIARVAGVPAPDSAESLDQLADVLSLLASGPDGAIPIDWLRPDRLDSVAQLASNGSSLEVERTELEQKHETRWLQLPLGNTWGADADALETAPGEQSALSRVGGRGWERWLVSVEQQSTATAQALDSAGADAARSVASLSSVLGLAEGSQFLMSEVRRLSGLATEIATVGRIPEVWVKADLEQLGVDYEEALGRQTTLRNAEDSLHELCDPSAIDLDDSLLLSRFRTEYGSFFRRLTGSYRADRDRVRQHLRSREKPSVDIAVEVLERVRAVRLAREEWDSHSDPLRLSLGDLFVGEATDFARIGSSVKAVRDRAGQWRGMASTIRERWTDREACEQVATEAPQLAASLDQLEELTSDLGGSTALGDQRRLSDVLDDLRVVRSAVERTDEVVRAYLGDFISASRRSADAPALDRGLDQAAADRGACPDSRPGAATLTRRLVR